MANPISSLAKKKRITLKGITSHQKDALVGGGLSFAALGMGVGLFKLLGSKHDSPASSEDFSADPIGEEPMSVEAHDEAPLVEEEAVSYGSTIEEVEAKIDSDFSGAASESLVTYSFYSEAQVAINVDDTMTFDEAFASARGETGAGGFFNYQGDTYSTFYKEGWEGMSEENKEDFFTQVESKSTFEIYDEAVNEVVEDYEIIEEGDSESADLIAEDDFFSDLEPEVQEEPVQEDSEADLIENDDFFNDLEDSPESDNVIVVRPVFGLDGNDDGVIDMVALDDNEDGIADVVALDEDYDGNYESFMINEDGGDNLDVFIVDQGLDGIDPSDSREDIDDIISMDDFIVLEDDAVENIENMEMIEQLLDNSQANEPQEGNMDESEDSLDNDFDEIGL